jgi:signal transduction histidine kinase
MKASRRFWQSIDRRLALVMAAVLLAATVAFAFAAYRRVQHALLAAAGPRLHGAATAMGLLLAQSITITDRRLAGVASRPPVRAFLRGSGDPHAVRAVLSGVWRLENQSEGRVALLGPDGRALIDTTVGAFPAASDWVTRTIDTARLTPGSARMGPFVALGDSVYYESLAPVFDSVTGAGRREDRRGVKPVGYVSDLRLVASPTVPLVEDLIGAHASLLLGSPSTGTWSDLQRLVTRVPTMNVGAGQPQIVQGSAGAPVLGVTMPVANAPWTLWVAEPVADILAPMHQLLREIITIATLVILAGIFAGWVVGRRIRRPLLSLTTTAEMIAARHGSTEADDRSGDEVTQLRDAIQRMETRVDDALRTAAQAQADAEAQAREARALAEELEQQVEEAQTLSEELQQSNAHLLRATAEANFARGEAEAANHAKADFLAQMSHELRTPLNAIAGFVELLQMEVAGPKEQQVFLARVKRAQGLLLRRIEDMLNFAKIESGTIVYSLTDIPVEELLAGIVTLMQPLMAQRGLALVCAAPPDLVVRADLEKCEQIVLNLLSNAIKFTESGGRVTLAAERTGDRIAIAVSDTGIGIPAEKLTAIFEPFTQVDRSLTRQREGTGLGLAISRQLARAMGGDITVASVAGAGSTFTLSLPAGVPMPSEAELALTPRAETIHNQQPSTAGASR